METSIKNIEAAYLYEKKTILLLNQKKKWYVIKLYIYTNI